MRSIHLRVWFVFLVLAYSNLAIANLDVIKSFEYYNIYPKNKHDINLQIQKLTPIVHNDTKFHGSTTWQVEWSISWKKSNEICYIDAKSAKLNVVFKMPRIPHDFMTTDAVLDTFNNYYEALLNHENGHMDSGINALKDINVLLAHYHSFSDCQALNESVQSSISQIIEKYKLEDIAYDTRTKHGKLQGVSIRRFI